MTSRLLSLAGQQLSSTCCHSRRTTFIPFSSHQNSRSTCRTRTHATNNQQHQHNQQLWPSMRQASAGALAAVQACAALLAGQMAAAEPALAVLNSPNARIPRTVDAALRRCGALTSCRSTIASLVSNSKLQQDHTHTHTLCAVAPTLDNPASTFQHSHTAQLLHASAVSVYSSMAFSAPAAHLCCWCLSLSLPL
jgi:hypothetical protein